MIIEHYLALCTVIWALQNLKKNISKGINFVNSKLFERHM